MIAPHPARTLLAFTAPLAVAVMTWFPVALSFNATTSAAAEATAEGAAGTPESGPQPVNLKPFLGKQQFQSIKADWMLPRGRQIVEGVPFQIDGIVELAGTSARFSNVGRTNVANIPIKAAAPRLFFLAAASRDANEGTAIARVQFHYADGTDALLPIEYGRHVADWMGPRHKGESPLMEPDARVAWQVEHPAAAKRDDSLRLFYFTLANPRPDQPVRALSLHSARARGGFQLAALSVGPEPTAANRPPDSLRRPEEHLHLEGGPGAKPALSGRLTDDTGRPVTNGLVRVLSVKTVDPSDRVTPEDTSAAQGRETTTDASGRYRLDNLSERLLYRVLFTAPGRQTLLFDGADPLAGEASVQLPAAPTSDGGSTPGLHQVHARLLGPDGRPVLGATVKPDGVGTGFSTSWGGNHGFPDEAVTGLNGEFIMAREEAFTRLSVRIQAAGLAPVLIWLPASNGVHEIRLGVGNTITGRVTKNGRPLADIELGISGAERNSEVFAGRFQARTDAEGRFRFEHVATNTDWVLYGTMQSLRRDGAITERRIRTGSHGATLDVGDLAVQPGLTLAGTVRTKDGQPLPSGLRLVLSYDSGTDSQTARIGRDGAFEWTGLQPGLVEIQTSTRGWTVASENRSVDEWNQWQLAGRIVQDKRDFLLVIEKRDRDYSSGYSSGNGQLPDSDRSRNRPIMGAEPSGPPPTIITGTVVDDATGRPIPSFQITPGWQPPGAATANRAASGAGGLLRALVDAALGQPSPATPSQAVPWNERPFWELGRVETFSNGRFSTPRRQLASQPLVRITADGYQPLDAGPYPVSTNVTLRLRPGSGPTGTIVGPNGQPAAGVTVAFASSQEQLPLYTSGLLGTFGSKEGLLTTGDDGRFRFPSRPGGQTLFAASPEGWASASLKNWTADGKLQLAPWGRLEGILTDPQNRPIAGANLGLQFVRGASALDSEPWVNIQERVTTDASGRFRFQLVPPVPLNVVHQVPAGPGGWMNHTQTNATVRPGQTLDLGRIPRIGPLTANRP